MPLICQANHGRHVRRARVGVQKSTPPCALSKELASGALASEAPVAQCVALPLYISGQLAAARSCSSCLTDAGAEVVAITFHACIHAYVRAEHVTRQHMCVACVWHAHRHNRE